jgi:hypothetical protein
MMRMAFRLFIGQGHRIIKTVYSMNFPKHIHKSLFLRQFPLYSLVLPAVYLTHPRLRRLPFCANWSVPNGFRLGKKSS